ncbi:zeta toxin family protein [Mucilaginibacter psychrotolerans]|uniref:Zeta toxin domain-containing protein n=1 Tax=Mucilaginibacter psychrotolerans TaxID=1524096 RepID=A0A4Y8SPM5_9SPHI|nr:zeta toxin family protein [Mucilaginibacter psychrotolerans]TFF40364.1 hypothetical protein E2R66_03705 [Mucilaginibacter psychrotolerans]
MPALTIIAGPNGAGKSSFSETLSLPDATIFDPDKSKAEIWHQYPDISDEAVEAELTRVYERLEQKVLTERLNFTIETNLRNAFLLDRAKYFKKRRYQVNLIFMMLPSISQSMDRVNLRIKRKGHFVDAESIKMNFEACIKQVKGFFPVITNLLLLDASITEHVIAEPRLVALYRNRQLVHNDQKTQPQWIYEQVAELFTEIKTGDETIRVWRPELP